ncbi:unnamed protein product [Protopolystoma xenopodis]|uniref:Uncharacterized protein n=1 Tax=Protopolystoma xenopodis TaxID=117903 RepID=A0A448WZ06_9PLAT|nr:unnamed protein product [Protopolystoma xenopodis]
MTTETQQDFLYTGSARRQPQSTWQPVTTSKEFPGDVFSRAYLAAEQMRRHRTEMASILRSREIEQISRQLVDTYRADGVPSASQQDELSPQDISVSFDVSSPITVHYDKLSSALATERTWFETGFHDVAVYGSIVTKMRTISIFIANAIRDERIILDFRSSIDLRDKVLGVARRKMVFEEPLRL